MFAIVLQNRRSLDGNDAEFEAIRCLFLPRNEVLSRRVPALRAPTRQAWSPSPSPPTHQ
jgi:hypothetical protein